MASEAPQSWQSDPSPDAGTTSRNGKGGVLPSRLVVGLAVGALDFEGNRPQHLPQRQGIDAVGLHDRWVSGSFGGRESSGSAQELGMVASFRKQGLKRMFS